jgi:hypothetical protein
MQQQQQQHLPQAPLFDEVIRGTQAIIDQFLAKGVYLNNAFAPKTLDKFANNEVKYFNRMHVHPKYRSVHKYLM